VPATKDGTERGGRTNFISDEQMSHRRLPAPAAISFTEARTRNFVGTIDSIINQNAKLLFLYTHHDLSLWLNNWCNNG
jgi:hypothetical protein